MTTTNPEFVVRTHHFSVADYHVMKEAGILEGQRVELLNGKIVDMSPIKSAHAGVVNRLNHLRSQWLPGDHILSVQNPVSLGEFSEPEPDLAVLQYRDDFYKNSHPTSEETFLVIEVAETSLEKDRVVKLPIYAEHHIQEVIIINLKDQQVEHYCQPVGGQYEVKEVLSFGEPMAVGMLKGKVLPIY
jgi:hypothetical protein